ncbi:hypothetical protein [Falsiroseomonas stagni]|uniref:hypothetical protein n=1 Tax=Falsiroseomonas stagni TaxID=484882 RepID=UPI000B82FB0A|nr:hypothetical protein [Falsiroseomonas stagni]
MADKPAWLRHKDRDVRWSVMFSQAKPREDGAQIDLALEALGYRNHVSIDRRHGLIGVWTGTHAAAHDGARLEEVLDASNTDGGVWADNACHSATNDEMLGARGLVSRLDRKKPKGRPMSGRTRRANAARSAIRATVQHVLAHQKGLMSVVLRMIDLFRARVTVGLVDLACGMRRLVWLSCRGERASRPCG